MLKIAGIAVAAAVAMLAVLSPVAFADDNTVDENTKEYEPQTCGNQPFEGLALGLLGHDAFEKAEKDENCNDRHKSDDGDDHKSHKSHD